MPSIIKLDRNKSVIVDTRSLSFLCRYRWYARFDGYNWYARATVNYETISMHRLIMNAHEGIEVDHRNGNTLDNRRRNLRFATRQQNNSNTRKNAGVSRFKGVCWHRVHKKWNAQIQFNKHKFHLGLFNDEISAARAYDKAARKHFGRFANTNF